MRFLCVGKLVFSLTPGAFFFGYLLWPMRNREREREKSADKKKTGEEEEEDEGKSFSLPLDDQFLFLITDVHRARMK